MEEGTVRAVRPRRRLLRIVVYTLASVIVVLGAGAAYLIATFDALDHRSRIVDFVERKTGRTLDIQGKLELSFWPDIAIELGPVSLSERASNERFASVESARVRLEIEPLLSREIVASELVLSGAHLRIARYADGRLNVDDLMQGEGGAPQFDIARLRIERSTLEFQDIAAGETHTFTDIALKTGRLAPDVATRVTLGLHARDAGDRYALRAAADGRITLGLSERRYALDDATLRVEGRAPGVEDLALHATGSATFDRATNALALTGLKAKLDGTHGRETIELALDAVRLQTIPGKAAAEGLQMTLQAKGAAGTSVARLAAPAMTRLQDRIGADAVTAILDLRRGEQRITATLESRVAVDIAARTVALSDTAARFTAAGPRLPRDGLAGTVRGTAKLDVEKEGIEAALAGEVSGSKVKARVTAAGFAAPVYTFAMEVDRLDLDRHASSGGRRAQKTAPHGQGLLSPLADLPASGTLEIGVLKVADATARNVRLVLE